MKKKLIEITTNEQLHSCMLSNTKVLLYYGEHSDDTDETVIIIFNNRVIKASNECYYFRENCYDYTYDKPLRIVR